jgi:hypothetical protein
MTATSVSVLFIAHKIGKLFNISCDGQDCSIVIYEELFSVRTEKLKYM